MILERAFQQFYPLASLLVSEYDELNCPFRFSEVNSKSFKNFPMPNLCSTDSNQELYHTFVPHQNKDTTKTNPATEENLREVLIA